ncbi:MAG: DUF3592 domain-containing protein [Bacilli bacterium]|nr:DUF3592 domain-containing protein [Bacilli bacterium]
MFNPEQSKELKILSGLLIGSFVLFLIGVAIAIYFIFLMPMNKEKTTATITKIENSSTTVVYTAEGRTYEKRFNAYSSNYYVGKKIKIYYNKQKPFDSHISSLRFLSLIAPGIGIIFMGVVGILCMVFYKKNINM